MNDIELAPYMKRLMVWMDERKAEPSLIRHHLPNSPYEDCYLTVRPDRQGPFPSGNENRVFLFGCREGETPEFLSQAFALFPQSGVSKFFVHLSPGPKMDSMRAMLSELGLTVFGGTGYPTLLRESLDPPAYQTDFSVRLVSAEEIEALSPAIDTTMGDDVRRRFAALAGEPGYHHFLAFEGEIPVASAVLAVFENMGYLTNGFTAEAYRRRGAQSALIAHRVGRAKEVGCRFCVSETLYMLQSSFQNLQRAGFREVYAKEIYEFYIPKPG